MNVVRLTKSENLRACLVALIASWPLHLAAQHGQASSPLPMPPHAVGTPTDVVPFVKLVRDATQRFQNVANAEREGYMQKFGCVSGGDLGAMGVHYVNDAKVGDPALTPKEPELLVYEPTPDGRLQLVAVDYLVTVDEWHSDPKNVEPPQLLGQLFHLFDAPNRFELPAFYTLHVWAWKDNPNGTFANWNPNVSCAFFNPREPR